jgi:phosphoserine phosphatase SerB
MLEKKSKFKLAVFDMDGTLLNGRGIFAIAEKYGFIDELLRLIRNDSLEFYERSIKIAKLSKGYKVDEYLNVFRKIKLQPNVEKIVDILKKKKIICAIATDSYDVFADDLKKRLGFDYAFANNLILNENVITGELKIHNKSLIPDFISDRIYSICKSNILEKLCKKHGFSVDQAIAIGDGKVDASMIKKAGLGIAFNAPDEVNRHADVVTNDLKEILKHI